MIEKGLVWAEKASKAKRASKRLYEGVLLEQLEDVLLVVEPGDVDGRLPVQVLQRPTMQPLNPTTWHSPFRYLGTRIIGWRCMLSSYTPAPSSTSSATHSLRP
ncbi:hypothetical protein PVAP13_9NG699014 [Panicum virgatum]|uniref:Uncharacterized protein n=1 Tax=Panicum virgatum TaxID=38727 RepID=A0A8T0MYG1_PANVG|nr:hypothetical protein PVAP13_9NG699014 [Panicum virgatum]